jgi:hypothetical protein
MYKKRPNAEIPDDATEDDKIIVDVDAPTIMLVEKVRFEETGKMGKIKMKMDFYNGGRFDILQEKKTVPPVTAPIEGKLNPPVKEEEDEVFNGQEDKTKNLPF